MYTSLQGLQCCLLLVRCDMDMESATGWGGVGGRQGTASSRPFFAAVDPTCRDLVARTVVVAALLHTARVALSIMCGC
jgi:hypothetical protein